MVAVRIWISTNLARLPSHPASPDLVFDLVVGASVSGVNRRSSAPAIFPRLVLEGFTVPTDAMLPILGVGTVLKGIQALFLAAYPASLHT